MIIALCILLFFFAFDPAAFAETAAPLVLALIGFLASFGIDLHGSRVRSAVGLLSAVYAGAAPYVGIMPNGPGRVVLFISGILLVGLNERLQGGASKQ